MENNENINVAPVEQKIKSSNNKFIIIGIIGAIIVIIIALLALMPSSDKAINSFFKGLEKEDSEEVLKYIYAGFYTDLYDMDEDELEEEIDDIIDEISECDEFFYEIDKDYKKYDKDDIDEYKEYYEAYEKELDDIKQIREYKVKIKMEYDGEKDTKKIKVLVIKIGSKWYVDYDFLDSVF